MRIQSRKLTTLLLFFTFLVQAITAIMLYIIMPALNVKTGAPHNSPGSLLRQRTPILAPH